MKNYKTVIVGGGIVGAGIFRDLALHGVETLLLDKGDFTSQTSQSSSKMLHGGIRYLENFDFPLVFEALHEKNVWLRLTPHLCFESPFYLPVFKDAKRPLWMIQIGMFLYDLLSSFKNSPYKMKSAEQVHRDIPLLKTNSLTGAGVYYDGIMDDAKLTLEVIYDALKETCASAFNYTEVINVKKVSGKNILSCKNTLTNNIFDISADNIIYALGPFTDQFLSKIPMYHWEPVLLPSKGSHLWFSIKDIPIQHPIVMTPKRKKNENTDRVIFVIPHTDQVLVGTTEVVSGEKIEHLTPGTDEIQYLLDNLNDYFPNLNLTPKNIQSSFSGVRPLVRSSDNSDRGKTSREHKIYQPHSDTYVIAGGKYTTFRVMGQEITKDICHKYAISFNADKSLSPLRQKSIILPFNWKLPTSLELILICEHETPKTFEDLIKRRLSLSSRKIWESRVPQIDFNEFFIQQLPILKKYIVVSESDIINFM